MNYLKSLLKPMLVLVSFSFAISAYAENADKNIIPGLLQIKFAKPGLNNFSVKIHQDDISDPGLLKLLSDNDFTEGRKIFPDFTSTHAISKTGEEIQLRDLSTWYLLKLGENTDLEMLIERLKSSIEMSTESMERSSSSLTSFLILI